MFRKITRKSLEDFLSKHSSNSRTLDIGSGGSSYHRFFPNRVTVDIDPNRKPDMVGDILNLPFKDNEFDLILCTEVLEHVKDPQKAISEIHRVLRKNGKVILTTRFVYPLHDVPGDYFRYTKYSLSMLFSDFNNVDIQSESRSFTTIATLLQRICFQSKLRFGKITKLFVFVLAYFISKLDWLIVNEYGDIKRNTSEKDIMPSGYYVTAIKR